jgi:hypothetical protein
VARTLIAFLSAALGVALLALASPASGSVTCAPPGVSGISQYVETLPGLSCSLPSPRPGHGAASHRRGIAGRPAVTQPPPSGNGRSGHAQGGSLPPATAQQLSRQGTAGQAVQRLVAQTGTAPRHHARRASGAASELATVPAAGRGAIGGLLHPLLSGSARGGTGALLPLFLGAALVVMVALGMRRRRRRSSP